METVYCPVMKEQVDGVTCLEIVTVADRIAKPTLLPDGVEWSEEVREICLHCKWHDDLREDESAEERLK